MLITGGVLRRSRRRRRAVLGDDLAERGEQRDRGDDRRRDREALGDRLGGVAHRVEAIEDLLGLAVELAGHLGDALGVVGDRAEGVLGDDDAVVDSMPMPVSATRYSAEVRVAAAERRAHADGNARSATDRPHRRLEARADAREHDGGRAGLARVGDVSHRLELARRVVLRDAAGRLAEHHTGEHGGEHAQARVGHRRPGGVADVAERDDRGADQGQHRRQQQAAIDRLERIGLTLVGLDQEDRHDRRHRPSAMIASGKIRPLAAFAPLSPMTSPN
jgi:hypothetical protein